MSVTTPAWLKLIAMHRAVDARAARGRCSSRPCSGRSTRPNRAGCPPTTGGRGSARTEPASSKPGRIRDEVGLGRHIAVDLDGRRAAGRETARSRSAQPRRTAAISGRIGSPWLHRIPLLPYSRAWSKFKELGPAGGRLPATRTSAMPELIPRSPDNPDFARVIEVRNLRDARRLRLRHRPDPGRGGGAGAAARRAGGAQAALRRPARAARPRRLAARGDARRQRRADLRRHASSR